MDDDLLTAALRKLIAPIVREAVADAFVEYDAGREPQPEYIDQQSLAQQLSTSIPTLRKLVEEGLPYVMVGDHRRFRMDDVRSWLSTRAKREER